MTVRLNVERVSRPGKLYATEQTLTLTPEEVAFSVTSPTQNGPVNLGAPVMELGSADRGKSVMLLAVVAIRTEMWSVYKIPEAEGLR